MSDSSDSEMSINDFRNNISDDDDSDNESKNLKKLDLNDIILEKKNKNSDSDSDSKKNKKTKKDVKEKKNKKDVKNKTENKTELKYDTDSDTDIDSDNENIVKVNDSDKESSSKKNKNKIEIKKSSSNSSLDDEEDKLDIIANSKIIVDSELKLKKQEKKSVKSVKTTKSKDDELYVIQNTDLYDKFIDFFIETSNEYINKILIDNNNCDLQPTKESMEKYIKNLKSQFNSKLIVKNIKNEFNMILTKIENLNNLLKLYSSQQHTFIYLCSFIKNIQLVYSLYDKIVVVNENNNTDYVINKKFNISSNLYKANENNIYKVLNKFKLNLINYKPFIIKNNLNYYDANIIIEMSYVYIYSLFILFVAQYEAFQEHQNIKILEFLPINYLSKLGYMKLIKKKLKVSEPAVSKLGLKSFDDDE